ncbi:hypothetical protein PKHYL_11650 [Psychrobacter sp. KH172YL61]|uniref:hypothetical protein n=1 Tax=Psychrobacter sp. KH172YL61 TaxID=2517899 RepID=UPI0010B90FFA|nr:hypothetical protein [Psychrobacter sp. KH172YL61]BBI66974.1 hypothetical protein PKHYL_11650 [Psychrobacter sp. KH172YL61]
MAQVGTLLTKDAESQAAYAIDAASSARVAAAPEAAAIKQAQTPVKVDFKPTAIVDIDNDNDADAAVGVLTEETPTEQVPVPQIVTP